MSRSGLGSAVKVCLGAGLLISMACRMDNPEFDAQATETQRPMDAGEIGGESSESSETKADTGMTAPGDGDGDTGDGDGDGDTGRTAPGDGDGDTGSSDSDTGDGDGDTGSSDTGDGDGDPNMCGLLPGDNAECQNCLVDHCCEAGSACLEFQPCACTLQCVTGGQPLQTCQAVCMFDNLPLLDGLFMCLDANCGDLCLMMP